MIFFYFSYFQGTCSSTLTILFGTKHSSSIFDKDFVGLKNLTVASKKIGINEFKLELKPACNYNCVSLKVFVRFSQFSEKLNKLFIDFNKIVLASCYVGPNPPDGLYVRVLPVYAVANSIQEPVKRCPNHAEKSDASNQGFNEV